MARKVNSDQKEILQKDVHKALIYLHKKENRRLNKICNEVQKKETIFYFFIFVKDKYSADFKFTISDKLYHSTNQQMDQERYKYPKT